MSLPTKHIFFWARFKDIIAEFISYRKHAFLFIHYLNKRVLQRHKGYFFLSLLKLVESKIIMMQFQLAFLEVIFVIIVPIECTWTNKFQVISDRCIWWYSRYRTSLGTISHNHKIFAFLSTSNLTALAKPLETI